MDTTNMTPGGIMPVFGGSDREPGSFTNDVKRRDWNMAGTAYYATAEAFNLRVLRANKRRISGLKRALWADSKANRKAYGVASPAFKFTPAATDNESGELPPWTAAWPAAVLAAEDLRSEGA
jgi:hypothetical protein